MIHPHHLAYAQARVQARLALRIETLEWQRLGAVCGLGPYLREFRSSSLGDWIAGISVLSDSHEIEQRLRQQFRHAVAETVGWVPEPWRPSVAWVGWLAHLPLLPPLLSGEQAPTWLLTDPLLGPCLDGAQRLRPVALAAAGGDELLRGGSGGMGLGEIWQLGWQRRWPRPSREVHRGLEELMLLLGTGWSAPSPPLAQAADALGRLGRRLEQLFHAQILRPPILFIYLALVGLDLRRLRGELLSRALFEARDRVP